jgi:hypothetical protein
MTFVNQLDKELWWIFDDNEEIEQLKNMPYPNEKMLFCLNEILSIVNKKLLGKNLLNRNPQAYSFDYVINNFILFSNEEKIDIKWDKINNAADCFIIWYQLQRLCDGDDYSNMFDLLLN